MSDFRKPPFRGRLADGRANPVDVHVGHRVYLRRKVLGLSQEKLAAMLGITFQQLQKYERGYNRIGASRLWDLSVVLKVSVSFFYEDMDDESARLSPRKLAADVWAEEAALKVTDPLLRDETYELVTAYYNISDREAAKAVHRLMKFMSRRQC